MMNNTETIPGLCHKELSQNIQVRRIPINTPSQLPPINAVKGPFYALHYLNDVGVNDRLV